MLLISCKNLEGHPPLWKLLEFFQRDQQKNFFDIFILWVCFECRAPFVAHKRHTISYNISRPICFTLGIFRDQQKPIVVKYS